MVINPPDQSHYNAAGLKFCTHWSGKGTSVPNII
uniref:Uncharacterized protein n=1 Tax=Anguilla anguilla TaxID=7936 RepID=A0A0E9TIV1_ANGAN